MQRFQQQQQVGQEGVRVIPFHQTCCLDSRNDCFAQNPQLRHGVGRSCRSYPIPGAGWRADLVDLLVTVFAEHGPRMLREHRFIVTIMNPFVNACEVGR